MKFEPDVKRIPEETLHFIVAATKKLSGNMSVMNRQNYIMALCVHNACLLMELNEMRIKAGLEPYDNAIELKANR